MNIVLRDKTSLVKNEITDINKALQINKERATGVITLIESLQRKTVNRLKRSKKTSNSTERSRSNTQQEIERLDAEIEKHSPASQTKKMLSQRSRNTKRQSKRLKRNVKPSKEKFRFLMITTTCPMCNSEITEEMKELKLKKHPAW